MRRTGAWSLILVLALAVPAFAGQVVAETALLTKASAMTVNLNTSSEADLQALPGVGPATAKKIVAGRPYTSVADLARVGVPKHTIAKITPLVTVGAGAPATARDALPPSAKGLVWANLSTRVYYKEGARDYGKTKNGTLMTEADAIKAGFHEAKSPGKAKQ